ncbi:hypothetical protein O7635_37415 [Asanoa sp. WMMD1127]|uniref:hypothetical protein n=1 Tax=Asanoa sp. WMMD1127 TaxID=3016107 RepID=UPI002416E372|nr:hypothetical protein [Asanoa sp. WMMD1127]MDG4827555.1 hypothetical protein [Asanoa sp. WMMD1127]
MAKSVRIPRTGSPRRALTQLAGASATGALHIGTDDCLYLVGGEVVFAESGSSPSIGDLLTASDRLAPQTWQAALATGGPVGKADVRPSHWLVQQGHLTHGELELCVLGAIYDAAYFALGSASALLRFVDGETHGMGAVTSVDPAVLAREAARRRKLLDEIYPEPGVDHAVVVPVRRPPVPRVVLSALQWEIVGRADGTLTPTGLARELGRAGYAVLTEVRRLAATGLIALPAGAIPLIVRDAPLKRAVPAIPLTDEVAASLLGEARAGDGPARVAAGDLRPAAPAADVAAGLAAPRATRGSRATGAGTSAGDAHGGRHLRAADSAGDVGLPPRDARAAASADDGGPGRSPRDIRAAASADDGGPGRSRRDVRAAAAVGDGSAGSSGRGLRGAASADGDGPGRSARDIRAAAGGDIPVPLDPASRPRGDATPAMPRRRTPIGADQPDPLTAPGDDPAPPIRAAVPAPAPPGSLPALPRREPGERLPHLPESSSAAPPVPADEALLKRIRTALKALR